MKEKDSRESKGLGFILFLTKEDAVKASSIMNGKQVWMQWLIMKSNFIHVLTKRVYFFCHDRQLPENSLNACEKNDYICETKNTPVMLILSLYKTTKKWRSYPKTCQYLKKYYRTAENSHGLQFHSKLIPAPCPNNRYIYFNNRYLAVRWSVASPKTMDEQKSSLEGKNIKINPSATNVGYD